MGIDPAGGAKWRGFQPEQYYNGSETAFIELDLGLVELQENRADSKAGAAAREALLCCTYKLPARAVDQVDSC